MRAGGRLRVAAGRRWGGVDVGGGRRLWVGEFGGLSSNQVGERRDVVEAVYAILKITPEGNAQLPAGRLQAQKGVPATAACVTPRPRAELPLLDVLPDVILRQVVVQWNFRMVENQQQLRLLPVNLPQHLIQFRPARLLEEQLVEVPDSSAGILVCLAASRATRALKAAECRLFVPVMTLLGMEQ